MRTMFSLFCFLVCSFFISTNIEAQCGSFKASNGQIYTCERVNTFTTLGGLRQNLCTNSLAVQAGCNYLASQSLCYCKKDPTKAICPAITNATLCKQAAAYCEWYNSKCMNTVSANVLKKAAADKIALAVKAKENTAEPAIVGATASGQKDAVVADVTPVSAGAVSSADASKNAVVADVAPVSTGATSTAAPASTGAVSTAALSNDKQSTYPSDSERVAQCLLYSVEQCKTSSYCKVSKTGACEPDYSVKYLDVFSVRAYELSPEQILVRDAYKALPKGTLIKTKMRIHIEQDNDAINISLSKVKATCRDDNKRLCKRDNRKNVKTIQANFGPMLSKMLEQRSKDVIASYNTKGDINLKIKKGTNTTKLFTELATLSGIKFLASLKLTKEDDDVSNLYIEPSSFIKRIKVPTKKIANETLNDNNQLAFINEAKSTLAKILIKLHTVKLDGNVKLDTNPSATLYAYAKNKNKKYAISSDKVTYNLLTLSVGFVNLSDSSLTFGPDTNIENLVDASIDAKEFEKELAEDVSNGDLSKTESEEYWFDYDIYQ